MVSRSLVALCSLTALVCPVSLCFPAVAQQPAGQQVGPPSAQPQPPNTSQAQPGGGQQPPLQLQSLPPDSRTLTPAEQEQARQQQVLDVAVRLASLQANWGAATSTPGLSMSLVEVGRTKTADGATQISYHVTASGFTPGDTLSLVRWPLDSEAHGVVSGLTLTPDGTAICPAPSPAPSGDAPAPPSAASAPSCTTIMKPNDPVVIQTIVGLGEPIRVALTDDNRRRGAATTTIPFPIANEDHGCRLQIILGLRDASMVLVEGTGFPPKTPLKITSIIGDNVRTLKPVTNPDGHFIVVDLAGAKGQDSGTATVRFAGITHMPSLEDSKTPPPPDPTCAPSITFPWGKGAYKLQ